MRKKILFLYKTPRKPTYKLWKLDKGPDTILYGANQLEKLGYDVDFYDIGFSSLNPIKWIFYPFQLVAAKRTGLGFNLGQAITLLPILNKYDVIVSTIDSAGLPCLLLKKLGLLRKPIIYTSIDFAFRLDTNRNKWPFSRYKTLLPHANAIVCNYIEEKKILDKFNKNVNFIRIGVDKDYYLNTKINNTKKDQAKILAFGRDRDRDYQTFISAITDLNVSGEIVCSQGNMKDVKLSSNTKVYYDLLPPNLKKKILEAKIIVIPIKNIKRSGGHLSLLDSLMSRKPVVVASNKGITKTYHFEDKKDCLFYEPENIIDLRKKIKLLLKDHKLALNLAANGRNKAKSYSTETYAKKIDKIIKRLITK